MFDTTKLPKRISTAIKGMDWTYDSAGKSKSTIMLFTDMVLKIEKTTRSSQQEIELLNWLDDKLPVPKIIEAETQDGNSFLLMTKMPGEMVCTGESMKNMESSVIAVADGLKQMWQINISNCPFSETVSDKLTYAKENIENNLVDINDFDPETTRHEGFSGISGLYSYLEHNRPNADLVFSHGDYTFQNVLVSGKRVTGLIDWGRGGISDRWQDIALIYRHLKNRCTKYGYYTESEYQKYKSLFFTELGIVPDEEKARYFVLLDEFF